MAWSTLLKGERFVHKPHQDVQDRLDRNRNRALSCACAIALTYSHSTARVMCLQTSNFNLIEAHKSATIKRSTKEKKKKLEKRRERKKNHNKCDPRQKIKKMRHYVTSAVSKCTFELNIFILQCMSDYLPSRLLSNVIIRLHFCSVFLYRRCTVCWAMQRLHNNNEIKSQHSQSIALVMPFILYKTVFCALKTKKSIFMSLRSVVFLALFVNVSIILIRPMCNQMLIFPSCYGLCFGQTKKSTLRRMPHYFICDVSLHFFAME